MKNFGKGMVLTGGMVGADGVRFTNSFVANSLSGPSRNSRRQHH